MAAENDTEHEARQAAVVMLRDGIATPAEVADLAGLSRQLVRYWVNSADVDWQAARTGFLAKHWRRKLYKMD